MRRAPLALVVVAGSALAGCGGGTHAITTPARRDTTRLPAARRASPSRPALCERLRARVIGHVDDAAATELSGLVASPSQPGVLWSHNDSGDRARVFALRARDGHVLASLDVPGAQAVDWEDIAVGPGGSLLLGDIGDNDARRPNVVVYSVPEPRLVARPSVTAPATALTLTYPDGAHDAETLLADRRTGELVIVTKAFSGRLGVYAARLGGASAQRLRLVGHVDFGLAGLATGGDVAGRVIAVRTYTGLYVWRRRAGVSIARTLVDGTRCESATELGGEGQGEALALARDGRSFWTVPEGTSPALRRYGPGSAR